MGFETVKAAHLRELARWIDDDPDGCNRPLKLGQVLERVAGGSAVPAGWRRIHARAQRELDSAACNVPHRAMVGAADVVVHDRKGFVALNESDAVVRGILRKAIAQARNTCQCCGYRGKPWPVVDANAVFCERCLIKRLALLP